MKRVLASLISLLLVQSASAADVPVSGAPCLPDAAAGLTDADSERVAGILQSRASGLAEALAAESAADRQAISALYAPTLVIPSSIETGPYQCRTIKLGGISPLVVYSYFSCEITRDGGTLTISKLTGSQTFEGTLTPSGQGHLYRGTLFYGYEDSPPPYGSDVERDQAGCLIGASDGGAHYLLELPSPYFESTHDIIELRR